MPQVISTITLVKNQDGKVDFDVQNINEFGPVDLAKSCMQIAKQIGLKIMQDDDMTKEEVEKLINEGGLVEKS